MTKNVDWCIDLDCEGSLCLILIMCSTNLMFLTVFNKLRRLSAWYKIRWDKIILPNKSFYVCERKDVWDLVDKKTLYNFYWKVQEVRVKMRKKLFNWIKIQVSHTPPSACWEKNEFNIIGTLCRADVAQLKLVYF